MLFSTALQLGPSRAMLVNPPSSYNTHKPLLQHGGARSLPLPAASSPSNERNKLSWRTSTSFKTAVAAVAAVYSSGPTEKQEVETKTYHFIVANAKFMLDEEEHFQEQLFERLRYFGDRDMEHDFWLVVEPKFLDKFPDITNRLKRPAVALVSTNGPWITFMKLRLDRVLKDSFQADSLEEALASNPVELKFEKPEKWVAPYPKYESGWWGKFLTPGSKTANV